MKSRRFGQKDARCTAPYVPFVGGCLRSKSARSPAPEGTGDLGCCGRHVCRDERWAPVRRVRSSPQVDRGTGRSAVARGAVGAGVAVLGDGAVVRGRAEELVVAG